MANNSVGVYFFGFEIIEELRSFNPYLSLVLTYFYENALKMAQKMILEALPTFVFFRNPSKTSRNSR